MEERAQISIRDVLAVVSRYALSALFLASIVCTEGTAQIRVGVWTDRPVYQFGDTIRITVTAFNASSDTAYLSFATGTQANYVLDDYDFFARNGGWTVLTYATILPNGSISWDHRYPYGHDVAPLSVGTHSLIGEVLGYGRSDTMTIIVSLENPTFVAAMGPTHELFVLDQNYPNPFNPSTTIKYELPNSSVVRLSVFDMLGREVSVLVNERRDAGVHEVKFDGSNLASGVYLYRLQAGDFTHTKRLVLLR